jgi:hypothetical protein
MGNININFAEVEGSYEPLPEGPMPVIIEKVEVRESKSSEHNYLNWEMVVQDPDHEGRRLWMITSLSPKALFRLKDVFEALGVLDDEMTIEWDDDVQITPAAGPRLLQPDVEGVAAIAVIKNEIYEGKERNKVDEMRAADDPGTSARSGSGARPRTPSASRPSGRRALR